MSRALLLLFVALTVAECSFLRTHNYWYTATRTAVEKKIPFADVPWGYCDMKCVYLEKLCKRNLNLNADFVVVWFTESALKPDFAACYVRRQTEKGVEFLLWHKVISNEYYKTNCGDGDDSEDYYSLTKGDDPKYEVTKVEGEGIGTEVDY